MSVKAYAQLTLTDLTDFEVFLSPSSFMIPTDKSYKPLKSGSQIVNISLKSGNEDLSFTISNVVDVNKITSAPDVTNKKVTFSWGTIDAISATSTYTFNLVHDDITIPAAISIAAGVQGEAGVSEKSRVNYYCVASKTDDTPAQPTAYPPTGDLWKAEEVVPTSDEYSYKVTYIIRSDNTGYYTNVEQQSIYDSIITDTTGLNTRVTAEADARNEALGRIESILKGTGDTTYYNELYQKIVKEYIIEDADTIIELGKQIYSKASGADSNGNPWSTLVALDKDGFTSWVQNNNITTSMHLTTDGVRISTNDTEDISRGLYSVLITNEGVLIDRAQDKDAEGNIYYETQSRFRRQQLTVQDVRIGSPRDDSADRTSMKVAADGGIMFVVDKAVAE